MTHAIAHELLRLPRRHPAEMRAIIAIAGWTQTLRRAENARGRAALRAGGTSEGGR